MGTGSRSGISRRDPHGLSQAERLRKFPRRLGQFPLSALAKPRRVSAPPVTSTHARLTTIWAIKRVQHAPVSLPLMKCI